MTFPTAFLAVLAFTFLTPKAAIEPPKAFEGTVTFSIEYIKVPAEVEGMESMLPQELIMSFSGDMVKLEQSVMGGTQIVLVDNKAKDSHIIMDMMGQKIDVYLTKEEVEAAEKEAGKPTIEELDGTKTILGYKCKEARITDPATGNSQLVFYTDKLDISHKDFKSLNGFPLEYNSDQDGMKLKMTATSVEPKKLPASHFAIPEGYTRMSMEDLMNFGQ